MTGCSAGKGAGDASKSEAAPTAATAADSGIDFILCEKIVAVQTTRHWVGGVNTKWHKEAGVEIDEGKLLSELTRYTSGRRNQQV